MRKLFPLFVVLSLCLTGCTAQYEAKSININNPYEIGVNGEVLSYYDSMDNFDTKVFTITDSKIDVMSNAYGNIIDINENNEICCILIKDASIITYKNISVGDSIDKIIESYEYEYKWDNNYMVIFNENVEEDPMSQNKEDNWLWINYFTDGKNITRIQIFDYKYGRISN